MTKSAKYFYSMLGGADGGSSALPLPGDNPALWRITTNGSTRTTTDGANRRVATPTHRARCTTDGVVRTTTAGDIRYTTD